MRVLLGISGASGAVYGVTVRRAAPGAGGSTCTSWSPDGVEILSAECGEARFPTRSTGGGVARAPDFRSPSVRLHADDDFRIPFASGSNPPDAMIIAPCSMGTVGRIASGVASSVLTRCADVAIKERRPLVLVVRETPLSVLHLENLLALARAGADVLPACPGFYHRPGSVSELVDFVAARALSRIGIEAGVLPRWGEGETGRRRAP